MIDRTAALPVTQQCRILQLSRSTVYRPQPELPEADLALMRRIDELHLESPFMGSRQLRDCLRLEGLRIGRKRVRRLMRLMGLEALYPKPNLSRPQPGQPVYPCYDAERVEQKKSELVARGNDVRFGRKQSSWGLERKGRSPP